MLTRTDLDPFSNFKRFDPQNSVESTSTTHFSRSQTRQLNFQLSAMAGLFNHCENILVSGGNFNMAGFVEGKL